MSAPRPTTARTTARTTSPSVPPSMDVLDVLSPGTFAASMAPLFEGAPRFLGRLAMARPFGTVGELFDGARRIAHSMPESEQLELVDAHPRIGAPPGAVSALSFQEQGYDRGPVTDLAATFDHLNAAYESLFGFRYCVFVNDRSRVALLPGFEAALEADRHDELHRALDAVIDIAADRYATLRAHATEGGS